jgi:streptogramin lyase
MDRSGNQLGLFNAGVAGDFAPSITTGPDQNIWFIETSENGATSDANLKRINLADGSLSMTTFAVPLSMSGLGHGNLYGLVGGPDGNLWFTEPFSQKVGKLVPSTGVETTFDVSLEPAVITVGPDGNLWFTEVGPGQEQNFVPGSPEAIGRIVP